MKLNDALNKPKIKFGADYRVVIGAFCAALPFFLAGLHYPSFSGKLVAIITFIVIVGIGAFIGKQKPRLITLIALGFLQARHYDSGIKEVNK